MAAQPMASVSRALATDAALMLCGHKGSVVGAARDQTGDGVVFAARKRIGMGIRELEEIADHLSVAA